MFKHFRFQSLAAQMNLILISVLLCLTIALGLTAYGISRRTIEQASLQRLEALAESQQTAIENQIQSHINQVNIVMKSDMLTTYIPLLNGEETNYSYEGLSAGLQRKKAALPDILQIDIFGEDDSVLASTDIHLVGEKVDLDDEKKEGWDRLTISNVYLDDGKFRLDMYAPITNSTGDSIALLYIHFDAKGLLHITGNYAGLGATGESLLGVREGNFINFITPLRFDPQRQNIGLVPISGDRAKPMIHATAGQTGSITSLDYRGVRVVAAYRQLSLTDWGLVVKQDEAEVYQSIQQLRLGLAVSVVLFMLVGLLVTLPLVNKFVRPLNELKTAIQKVIDGDLDVRVPVYRMDEVGELAAAFNRMTLELQNIHKNLMRRNDELSSFAYVVSHDLRAPLRGIHSLSGWIEEDLNEQLNDEQRKQISLLKERVMRMDALINDLLEYSRAGQESSQAEWVNVADLIGHVIASISPPSGFDILIDGSMPSMKTNELHLSQVFQNLIDNAIKHHPGPNGIISISSQEREKYWQFKVYDNGNGIESRHQERIFQIFQTLNPGKDGNSTGIGLALVKKIVENQGGTIRVESDGLPGHGATFIFTWLKE